MAKQDKKPPKKTGAPYKDINPDELLEMAQKYCDECISNTNDQATGSGKVVQVRNRHIPTIGYFLLHWLRREQFEFYGRTNFYTAMNDESHPLSNTIKKIDAQFKELAVDIVANEGKGIFYAKNRLGMHDQQKVQTEGKIEVNFKDMNI